MIQKKAKDELADELCLGPVDTHMGGGLGEHLRTTRSRDGGVREAVQRAL